MDSPCYLAALRILAYRFNAEGELRRKLRRKRFEAGDVDAAIERLRTEGWIDDERFAGAFVRTRALKRVGRQRIARELQAAGVDEDTVSRAVADHLDAESEREALRVAASKRARILAGRHGPDWLGTAVGRNKLTGYLLKQGYEAALVYAVLKEIGVVDHQSDS